VKDHGFEDKTVKNKIKNLKIENQYTKNRLKG